MPFQRGTVNDYREFLEKLNDFLTNDHVATVAVNAGGTGYVVGDLLTVAGGTVVNSMTAIIEVTSVAGGVIDGVRVHDWGAYSADPGLTANAVTGGTGSSATMDLTMSVADWTERIANVSTATTDKLQIGSGSIGASGSSYVVSDVVTLSSGLGATTEATFTVLSVDGGGGVTGIAVANKGDYPIIGGATYATTGGTGTGLTIDPVFIPLRDEYLWEGTGTGGVEVFASARTGLYEPFDQPLIELAGGTGWNGGTDWDSQPGISPGRNEVDPEANRGAGMLVEDSSMSFWFAATARRIVAVAAISGNIQSGHIGLLDPYGSESEIPYPFYVAGTIDRFDNDIGTSQIWIRGIADPTAKDGSADAGPAFFRDGGATWEKVYNGNESGGSISSNDAQPFFLYPGGRVDQTGLADEDILSSQQFDFADMIPIGRTGNPDRTLEPAPDSGGDKILPIGCAVIRSNGAGTHRAMGVIDGVFWINAVGVSSQDRLIDDNGDYFRVFQMGGNSTTYSHWLLRED